MNDCDNCLLSSTLKREEPYFKNKGCEKVLCFNKNNHFIQKSKRAFGRTIIITDNHDWSTEEIAQAYSDRNKIEEQFRIANSELVKLMPQYHWTDQKLRMNLFTCVVSLTYLTLLKMKLMQSGLTISIPKAMEQLRKLRTSIFLQKRAKKPERILEEANATQLSILKALGYIP